MRSAELIAAREQHVARGATNPKLTVARASGSFVEDLDGKRYLDFVGGIGCQNLGHSPQPVLDAVHAQVDKYLHQMNMVASYEPYIEVCRKLNEVWPGAGTAKSFLTNSGAEAVENAVKIARAATGRPGVVVFDRAFHGRTLLTMSMTAKIVYKRTFGPFAPEIYRAPAPYPYRGISTDDALRGLEWLFKAEVDPASIACAVLEPVQGEGGFLPMPDEYLLRLKELLASHGILFIADEIQSGCGRTGTMWAVEHSGVQPDLLISAKTLGGGFPLGAVTGRAKVMDGPHVGGLGGTFSGNPVACAAASVILDLLRKPETLEVARAVGDKLRGGLEDLRSIEQVGDVRGIGPMVAIELVDDRATKAPATELAGRVLAEAFDRGLLLLGSGIYSNVIRFLPPINLSDDELAQGLSTLEASLLAAGATRKK